MITFSWDSDAGEIAAGVSIGAHHSTLLNRQLGAGSGRAIEIRTLLASI